MASQSIVKPSGDKEVVQGSYFGIALQQALTDSGIFALLGNQTLIRFSLIDKNWHSMLFDTICESVSFSMVTEDRLVHYHNPRKAMVFSPYKLLLYQSFTHLECFFNEKIDHLLPKNITHLTFGNAFDQPVDHLPQRITHLTFGENFNHEVDHLPSSIKRLTFGIFFNQPVNNLPSGITHLIFGTDFNHPVDRLPSTIVHLTLGYRFSHSFEEIPKTIIVSYKKRRLGRASKE